MQSTAAICSRSLGMKFKHMPWMALGVVALSLANLPHVAWCYPAQVSTADELVTAIGAAFPEGNNVADEQAVPDVASKDSSGRAEVAADGELAAVDKANSSGEPVVEATSERRLSVAPGAAPYYPENTPTWIRTPPDYSSRTHVIPVGSIPAEQESAADRWLDEQLLASLYAYIDEHLLEAGAAKRLQNHVTVDYIRKNLIDDPMGYTVQLQTGSGPLFQKWVQVEISPLQRQQMRDWHREAIQRERFVPLGVGVAGLLSLIGAFHLLVRRVGSSAKMASSEQVSRQGALPVMKVMPGKKACCGGGFFPLALIALPILIALGVARQGRESRKPAKVNKAHVEAVKVRKHVRHENVGGPPLRGNRN
jgi:hypothetical protein